MKSDEEQRDIYTRKPEAAREATAEARKGVGHARVALEIANAEYEDAVNRESALQDVVDEIQTRITNVDPCESDPSSPFPSPSEAGK